MQNEFSSTPEPTEEQKKIVGQFLDSRRRQRLVALAKSGIFKGLSQKDIDRLSQQN